VSEVTVEGPADVVFLLLGRILARSLVAR